MSAKKILMAASVGLALSTGTFAQSATNLTVTGNIAPAACIPTLSGGGVADYGKLSPNDLAKGALTSLPWKTLNLTVTCDAATRFALKAIDNRKSSATVAAANTYGLGMNGPNKIGYYSLHIVGNQQGDGKRVVQLFSKNNGGSWSKESETNPSMGFRNDAITGFARPGGTTAENFQSLALQLRVVPRIARSDSLDLTGKITLDGSVTIEVVYL